MKITKIREVKTPTRGTECSAGLDFYVPKGFSEPLTFYCARHTWASLSNAAEVPLTVISKGMGHTDIKTTQIYLASIQTDVVDRYSEKLYTKYGL